MRVDVCAVKKHDCSQLKTTTEMEQISVGSKQACQRMTTEMRTSMCALYLVQRVDVVVRHPCELFPRQSLLRNVLVQVLAEGGAQLTESLLDGRQLLSLIPEKTVMYIFSLALPHLPVLGLNRG